MKLKWELLHGLYRPLICSDYDIKADLRIIADTGIMLCDDGYYRLKVRNGIYGTFDTLVEAQIKAHEIMSDLVIHQDYIYPAKVCHMENGFCAYPVTHDIIGWKKAMAEDGNSVVVKLKIPYGTAANITSGKCRAEHATVLDAYYTDTGAKVPANTYIYSLWILHDLKPGDFMFAKAQIDIQYELGMFKHGSRYKVGDHLFIPNFSRSGNTCAPGIHFFRSRHIAKDYMFT